MIRGLNGSQAISLSVSVSPVSPVRPVVLVIVVPSVDWLVALLRTGSGRSADSASRSFDAFPSAADSCTIVPSLSVQVLNKSQLPSPSGPSRVRNVESLLCFQRLASLMKYVAPTSFVSYSFTGFCSSPGCSWCILALCLMNFGTARDGSNTINCLCPLVLCRIPTTTMLWCGRIRSAGETRVCKTLSELLLSNSKYLSK